MKRFTVIGVACAVVALLCGGLFFAAMREPAVANSDIESWPPSAAAIRAKIGTWRSPAAGLTDDERRAQFCDLFKSRYRLHEPAIAIRVLFLPENKGHMKLMCQARMEPYLMDQIALAAWHEARENFGKPVDIDIYDTFIGTNQIKIGELRATPGRPDVASIKYDFRPIQALNRPRTVERLPIEPAMDSEPRRPAIDDPNAAGRPTL